MEQGLYGTPRKANSLYTPMDNTPLHSIPGVCRPWGNCYCCCEGTSPRAWRLWSSGLSLKHTLVSYLKSAWLLHLQHSIIMKLEVCKTDAVILTSVRASSFRRTKLRISSVHHHANFLTYPLMIFRRSPTPSRFLMPIEFNTVLTQSCYSKFGVLFDYTYNTPLSSTIDDASIPKITLHVGRMRP